MAVLREVKYLNFQQQKDIPDSAESLFSENETFRKFVGNLELIVGWYNEVSWCSRCSLVFFWFFVKFQFLCFRDVALPGKSSHSLKFILSFTAYLLNTCYVYVLGIHE